MSDSEDIKVGDKVWLKSGGPPMMVRTVDTNASSGESFADCEWFVGTAAHRNDFALSSLTKIPPTA